MKQELRVNICKSKSDLIAWVVCVHPLYVIRTMNGPMINTSATPFLNVRMASNGEQTIGSSWILLSLIHI